MFGQVCIDDQNEEASIEKLGREHFICNRRLLFTASIFSDPDNELNNYNLKNDIDGNDDESNRLTHKFGHKDVFVVLLADGPIVNDTASHPY